MEAILQPDIAALGSVLRCTEKDSGALIVDACLQRPLLCAPCRSEAGVLTGRWISKVRLSRKEWLIVLKCFELGLNIRETSELAGITRMSVQRAQHTIRLSLAAGSPSWRGLLPALRSGGLTAPPDVFGVFHIARPDRTGTRSESAIRVVPLSAERAASLEEPPPEGVQHRDGFTYAQGQAGYDAIILNRRADKDSHPAIRLRSAPYRHPFLAFLLNQTARLRGWSPESFPLYLKEWELRFNHSGQPMLDTLLNHLTAYLPERELPSDT